MKRKTYLRGFPATCLSLVNLLFSLITLVILFRTVFFLGTFIGSAIRAFQFHDFSMIQNTLMETLASLGLSSFSDKTPGNLPAELPVKLPFGQIEAIASMFPVFCLALLYPILSILNGFGSFSLRFGSKGSRMLQVIHVIYAVFGILTMIAAVACTVFIFITANVPALIKADRSGTVLTSLIIIGVVLVLFLIIEFLRFSYHKDIAHHMSFISSDLSDIQDYPDENHLSGIALIFGLFFLVIAGTMCYLLSLAYSFEYLMAGIILSAYALKYFLVAAANRKLKQSILARDRRSRR